MSICQSRSRRAAHALRRAPPPATRQPAPAPRQTPWTGGEWLGSWVIGPPPPPLPRLLSLRSLGPSASWTASASSPECVVAADVGVAVAGGQLGGRPGLAHVRLCEDAQGGVLVQRLGHITTREHPCGGVDVGPSQPVQ